VALDGDAGWLKPDISDARHRQGVGDFARCPGEALVFFDVE
jgi:hypothetical protein